MTRNHSIRVSSTFESPVDPGTLPPGAECAVWPILAGKIREVLETGFGEGDILNVTVARREDTEKGEHGTWLYHINLWRHS